MVKSFPQLAEFIQGHSQDDPDKIRLAGKEICGFDSAFVADQLEARQRYRKKFPELCADPLIIFPPKHNLEQSSSEITAAEKADFMLKTTGSVEKIIDLTSGFGIDAMAMAKLANHLLLIEPDKKLRELAAINFERKFPSKATWYGSTAEDFLESDNLSADWIYLDPSRRMEGNRKYRLEDTTPNPIALMDKILQCAPHVLTKTSPMLDITSALRTWNQVADIIIISVLNECREVLYHLTARESDNPAIHCINISSSGRQFFSFLKKEEQTTPVRYSDPLCYLLEPNSSVLKAGAFKKIADIYNLKKLSENTHLYTSNQKIENFPGKIFLIDRLITKKDIGIQANCISRNHPLSAEEIKKRFKVTDGGVQFIIACSGVTEKFIVLAKRIS